MDAVADHGVISGDTVSDTSVAAQQVFDALESVGIDVTDVFLTLENEGVQKFEASWSELAETVQGQLDGVSSSWTVAEPASGLVDRELSEFLTLPAYARMP